MKLLSSLRGRIFLSSALLAVLSIVVAIYLVNVRVTREAERALQREIIATGTLVDQLRTTQTQTFTTLARLIADTSKLKAATSTNDPQTVLVAVMDIEEHLTLRPNLLIVTNKSGDVLTAVGISNGGAELLARHPAIHDALTDHESVSLLPQSNGMLQLIAVPIAIYLTHPEMLGTLSIGFLLDDEFAARLKAITGSDLAFGMNGQVLATTLAREHVAVLAPLLREPEAVHNVRIGDDEYVGLPRRLATSSEGDHAEPVALILRSRTEQLAGLHAIHTALGATAVVAVLVATVLGFAVARTITQPLATITDTMRVVAETGDLRHKIRLRQGDRWGDEDARLLATTFNTLTDSVARFQREVFQKERLSSLGRLSTVIAHEIRNPLMIIKASLHSLRQKDGDQATLREAVADIDDEIVRLNRIVNEVLDFARPIRFELTVVDLNLLCTEAAAAARASGPDLPIALVLDPTLPPVTTDLERLRLALVNLLVNARQAVAARPASDSSSAPIALRTASLGERVSIVIADTGVGIDQPDLTHVFDPYFTTKRGGTGLGLAIAKNIVEGLGGTISVTSSPGRGTEVRIELPFDTAREPSREAASSMLAGASGVRAL
jgi:signal transduction histidine kinase